MTPSEGYTELPAGKVAAIVTSLEMSSRPAPRSDPPAAPWQLQHHARIDPARFRDVYRRIGEDLMWSSRLALDEAALTAIIHDPAVEVRTLRVAGTDEGLLELDFRHAGVCELSFFGVTPGLVGTGAGRWLMNRALEIVWARPIRRFWVHTCTHDHPNALAFYMRSGFRPFRRHLYLEDDPRLAGILPRTAAPQIPLL